MDQIPQTPEQAASDPTLRQALANYRKLIWQKRESYNLILGWCFYLIGCWAFVLQTNSQMFASRLMVFAMAFGLLVLWPMFRLSQDRLPAYSEQWQGDAATMLRWRSRRIWRDWLYLIVISQTVLWPLRVNTDWPIMQVAWMAAALASWSLLFGVVLIWGISKPNGMRRLIVMAIFLVVVMGEPMVMSIGLFDGSMRLSPLAGLWELGNASARHSIDHHAVHISIVAGLAVAGWAFLAMLNGRVAAQAASGPRPD